MKHSISQYAAEIAQTAGTDEFDAIVVVAIDGDRIVQGGSGISVVPHHPKNIKLATGLLGLQVERLGLATMLAVAEAESERPESRFDDKPITDDGLLETLTSLVRELFEEGV